MDSRQSSPTLLEGSKGAAFPREGQGAACAVSAMSHLSSSSHHQTLSPHPVDLAQACGNPPVTPALPLATAASASPAVPSIGSHASSADSAKSFPSSLTPLSSSQAQAQPLGSRDDGDNQGKHGSTPSAAPIDSVQKANFISATSPTQLAHFQQHQSSAAGAGAAQNTSASIADDSSPTSSTLLSAPTGLPSSALALDAFVGSFPTFPAPTSSSVPNNTDSEMKDAGENAAASAAALATSSASTANATGALSLTQRLHARIAELVAQRTAASAASPASPAASAASSFSAASAAICHCLMLDGSRFAADSEQDKQLKAAFAIAPSSHDALVSHLADWLKLDAANISAAYTEPAHRRIHINFRSIDALSSALRAAPLLMRCNAERSTSHWIRQPARQCGAKREEQQELVQLSATLVASVEPAALTAAITSLLTELQVDVQCFWLTPKNRYDVDKSDTVTINLLPRDIRLDALAALVTKLEAEWNLFGRLWFVHAPRQPTLERCRTCKQLGHNASRCTRYNFLALRFLGKHPLPYSLLLQLLPLTGARGGYLGASLEERAPHCKLTLLFDGDADDAATQEQLVDRVSLLFLDPEMARLFLELPCIVKPTQRHSECKQCNHHNGAHECPLAHFASDAAARSNGNRQPSRATHGSASAPVGVGAAAATAPRQSNSNARASNMHRSSLTASSAPRKAHDPSDKMCGGWRAKLVCPRAALGQACTWEHPESHMPVCGDFLQGKCTRVKCRFSHAAPEQPQPQQAASVASPSAAAPASAAASSPAAVPAATASQPAGSASTAAVAASSAAPRGPVIHVARSRHSAAQAAAAGGRASAASKHNTPVSSRHASPATRTPAAAATPKSSPRKRGRPSQEQAGSKEASEDASAAVSPSRSRSKKLAFGLTAAANPFDSLAAGMELEEGEIAEEEEKKQQAAPTAKPVALPAALTSPPQSSLGSLPPPASHSAHIPTKTGSVGRQGAGAVEVRNNEDPSSKTTATAASGMPPPTAPLRSPSKGKKPDAKGAKAAKAAAAHAAATASSHQSNSEGPSGL